MFHVLKLMSFLILIYFNENDFIAFSQMASHPRSLTETIASSLNNWRQRRKTREGVRGGFNWFANSIHSSRMGLLTNIYQQRQPFVLGLHLRGVTRASYHPIWLSVLHLRLPSGQSKTRSCLPTDLISSHQSKASSSNGLCLSVSTDTQSLHVCLRLRRSSSLEAWLAIFLAGTCLSFCFLCLTFCLNPVRIHFLHSLYHKSVCLFMHNSLIMSHLFSHNGWHDQL